MKCQKGKVRKKLSKLQPPNKILRNKPKEVKDILLRTLKILIKGICGAGEDS